MNLNKATLIGNLVADPEAKKMPSGIDLSVFRVATNHTWKDKKTKEVKESVEYHHVIAWGKLAGIINKYLKKGSSVYLEGRIVTRSWEDDKGIKRYMTEIIADQLIMLGHKNKEEKQPDELTEEDITVEEVKEEEIKN
ncbi:single-stranded DNA-binding protein [Patescibacteria group bacterium]|nr:single-stranded DNA-binding protein [Patescibacteria group bacterium]